MMVILRYQKGTKQNNISTSKKSEFKINSLEQVET